VFCFLAVAGQAKKMIRRSDIIITGIIAERFQKMKLSWQRKRNLKRKTTKNMNENDGGGRKKKKKENRRGGRLKTPKRGEKKESTRGEMQMTMKWSPLAVVVHGKKSVKSVRREDVTRTMNSGEAWKWKDLSGRMRSALRVALNTWKAHRIVMCAKECETLQTLFPETTGTSVDLVLMEEKEKSRRNLRRREEKDGG